MAECSVPGCWNWGRFVIYIPETEEELRYCEEHFLDLPKKMREKAIDLGKFLEVK